MNQNNKTALLFGGSGFLGRHITASLLQKGWQVAATGRRLDHTRRLLPLGTPGQVTPLVFNARDNPLEFVRAVQPNLVINLIGILHARPGGFRKVHVGLAKQIAEAAAAEGVQQLIQVSAIGADTTSSSRYARSKALGEQAVLEAFAGAVIVRPSVVFGDDDQFVRRFAGLLAFAPAMPLIGGGRTTFQPVFVGDLARAIARIADAPEDLADKLRGTSLEFGGAQKITLKELHQDILAHTGHKCLLFPLSFMASRFIATPLAVLPAPPLTPDQVTLLKYDNLVSSERDGFARLGMEADPLSFHLPALLAPWTKPYVRKQTSF